MEYDSPVESWGAEMDAMVASPDQHELILENEQVRVLRTHILPGEIAPLHTHPYPAVLHILSWSDIVRRDYQGEILTDTRLNESKPVPGTITWSGPMGPHSVENVGDSELIVIATELKS